jgi:uncharacterized protein YndB with AHSA1/START domain
MPAQSFRFEQLVKASPTQVYKAFTNATALREWICDVSTVDPHPGGRFYLAWNRGYYACGEYTSLDAEKRIAFTWCGRNEPGVSNVEVTLAAEGGNTKVNLVHTLPESSQAWDTVVKELEAGWKSSLENLASVLETGIDLRITRRPMLGITLSDFNAELAKKLSVPVTEGLRIDSLIDGMGAQAAGLQSSDVIVKVDGREIRNFADVPDGLEGKRAGDKVKVTFYRGSEKKTVELVLSGRQIPEIPATLEGLIHDVKEIYARQDEEINALFNNVTEEEASYKPKPDDWSAKEVLAHLIHSERFFQTLIVDLLGRQERWTDQFAGNLAPPILATIAAFPTLPELLKDFKNSSTETIALYSYLPPEFMDLRGSYWRVAFYALEGPYHFQSHLEQMRAAIEAAREK